MKTLNGQRNDRKPEAHSEQRAQWWRKTELAWRGKATDNYAFSSFDPALSSPIEAKWNQKQLNAQEVSGITLMRSIIERLCSKHEKLRPQKFPQI